MASLIHILHLEDDSMDAELVQARLEEAGLDYSMTWVQTHEQFDTALRCNDFDIVLADYRLPHYDGMLALKLVMETCPDVPFIFVSGAMGEDAVIEGLTKGATDYVLKQRLARLVPAVERALREAQNRRERRQAEKALAESEAKMRCILDSVDEGFILVNREYRILSANRAFCNLANLRQDQVIGRLCHEILHPSDQPCFESGGNCPVKLTLETGMVHFAIHTRKDESGAQQYVELKSYPIIDASGTVASAIETVNDVTEKRKYQEQLVRSQKLESVARLAGGVAHDYNNMLGVIIGYSELAIGQMNSSHPLFNNLQEIRAAAERSVNLTRQLLAFARQQTVAPRVLDLNETVADMLKILRPLIGENIDLAWRPGDDIWPVKMDPSQIDQILANLCVNARDAIDGVGRISIETGTITLDENYCVHHPELVPGEYVLLTVSDDGCGMDSETLSKIFEPFFTTKEIGRGTGLGLATIYGIVMQNHGFVNVSSEPERGTTFKIYLPRQAAATAAAPRENHAAPVRGGSETILLVEDEYSILKMAKLVLEKFGYRVLSASTPGKAIDLANTYDGEIHLLIVDVIMPEMRGRDLAAQVVTLHPKTVCLFMSGYSGNAIAHHDLLEDGINFIQKPFTMQSLATKVREILDSRCENQQ